ncbi:Bile acid 7-alpha dehydratase, putative [Ricinus communis]|uniref:Bile acid 7-alpha dehydratase, putative n=1 Tax=Ricinus communis TaxID=3988 RepID=B9TFI6_RICCO|nr:Bile acid 7-alpha dehydratase, putative [Ricinus communis]
MTELERLLAIEAIKRLKARYFRCVDTKDWDGFATVFAPDVRLDIDVPGTVLSGPAQIVESVRTALAGCTAVHHGFQAEIDITSATTAKGIWAMEDILRWSADSAFPNQALHGYGHYIETYELIDGDWLIKTSRLQRLRVDIEAAQKP